MLSDIIKITKDVGHEILKWRKNGVLGGKWEGSQFKAQADLLAHQSLVKRLKLLAPDIPVISEEDDSSLLKHRPDCYWLIDPIDGTASYIGGYPGFVTQVALMEKGLSKKAAIYAPVMEELYTAERGGGAYLNDKRFYSNEKQEMTTLIDNYPEPRGITLSAYKALNFTHYVECGGISLKILKVAAGEADLFFKNVVVRDWDLAAPHLVLEEAGGFLSDIEGSEINYIGDYEKNGIVCAPTKKIAMHLISWYKDFACKNEIE